MFQNIQKLIQKVVGMIDSRKDQIMGGLETLKGKEGAIKENLGKLKFDLRWEVEMGDCEVSYGEQENSGKKAQGLFKVTNNTVMNQVTGRFLELEQQLIKSKTDFATTMNESQTEKDEINRKVKELEEKLNQAVKDRETYEKRFVDAKMALSEVQMQNQDMQRNLFNLERKARGNK